MARIALVSLGNVGRTMSGPGIRYYHFARELAKTHDVTLFAPNEPDVDVPVEIELRHARDDRALGPLVDYDVVIAQRLPLRVMQALARARTRTIYDLYVPFLTEDLGMLDVELPNAAADLFVRRSHAALRYSLAVGSAFICASERQRDFWLGMLGAAERLDLTAYRGDRHLRNVIDVVPFGLPAEPPKRGKPVLRGVHPAIGADDVILLWAGGIWNWYDPLTVISAVAELGRDDVKLVFLGVEHPQVPVMEAARRAREGAERLGLIDRTVVFRSGWVPYEDRQRYLLEADVGVSAHFDSLETRFAFRTRVLDHFWAGLPTLTTRGDVLSKLVQERGLGRALPARDVGAWCEAIEWLANDVGERSRIAAALEPVRREFEWPHVLGPLLRLVDQAVPAPASRSRALDAGVESAVLRARISMRLGGPVAFLRRKAAKLVPDTRRS